MKTIIQYTFLALITTSIGLSVAFKTTKTIVIDSGKTSQWSFPETATGGDVGKCLTVQKAASVGAARVTAWK